MEGCANPTDTSSDTHTLAVALQYAN